MLTIAALMGCGGRNEKRAEADNSTDTVAAAATTDMADIVTRIDNIYADVLATYRIVAQDFTLIDTLKKANFEQQYFTSDFYTAYAKALENSGDEGLGGDHWIMGQDWPANISLSVDSVTMTDDQHATAFAVLHSFDDKIIHINLTIENDNWRIDDFAAPADEITSYKQLYSE